MSVELLWIVVVIAALVALYVAADRTRVLAVCMVERGKVRVVRGRLAAAVLYELNEVARRARLAGVRLEVRKDGELAGLRIRGDVDPDTQQQLRNVIGRFPLARLR